MRYWLIFRSDSSGNHNWSGGYECCEEMAEICEFRDATPRPKVVPKNPRSEWIQCECGGRHRTQETQNTCRFYREQFSALEHANASPVMFRPDGSREPWPPYKTSLSDEMVWKSMVDKIIARDGGCCTDCGINMNECDAISEAGIWYGHRGTESRYMIEAGRAIYDLRMEAMKQLPKFEVHHIVPRTKGGTHHPHNLRLLCSECHRRYTNELMGDLALERRVAREKAECEARERAEEEWRRKHPSLETFEKG